MDSPHHILKWPNESAKAVNQQDRWSHAGSNLCLDFHGDPVKAELVVFSDGNHHMALEESLSSFAQTQSLNDIFYATTPPGVLVQLMKRGQIHLGNLTLSRQPDIFIGPQNILEQLKTDAYVQNIQHFMRSRCNVLLVADDNPKNINSIADILRDDVKLFISNPETEKASYQVYAETLCSLAKEQGLDAEEFTALLSSPAGKVVYGECIHHRELPQSIAAGRSDVAMVYYHLALRYTRIFPGQFKIIPLGGDEKNPQPTPAHHITDYYVGMVNPDNPLTDKLIEHLLSQQVTDIYTEHGLIRP
ncbi:MAG: substrate-binding domain-containing protein [Gammaproteobacteria bacterium]|nr:substrate-binding domain-containing protein [Gammaproteobacteria bacterium]